MSSHGVQRSPLPALANGNGTWLPDYHLQSHTIRRSSTPPACGRTTICHEELYASKTVDQGNLQGENSPKFMPQPSSCLAACQKCREIPYTLFTNDGSGSYYHYANYGELSKSAKNGCCLCWFFAKHLAGVISLIRKHERTQDESMDSLSNNEITLQLSKDSEGSDKEPRKWILLFCGMYSTRIYWNFVDGEDLFPKSALIQPLVISIL